MRDELFKAELRTYEKVFAAVCGFDVKCLPAKDEKELGYTTPNKEIYLAYFHEIMNGLIPERRAVFRRGIFVHEMLHQIFTDFNAEKEFLRKRHISLNYYESYIYHQVANVLEDSAIENFAPQELSDSLLKSLRFSIAWIWKKSEPLDKSDSAFSQFFNALIQMGDLGCVKGKFTFSQAEKVFDEVLPIFNKGVMEPAPDLRAAYAYDIFDISRPLWKDEADSMEDYFSALKELLKNAGKFDSAPVDPENMDSPLVIPVAGDIDEIGEHKQNLREAEVSKTSKTAGMNADSKNKQSRPDDNAENLSENILSDETENACSNTDSEFSNYDISDEEAEEIAKRIEDEYKNIQEEDEKKKKETDNTAIPDFVVNGIFKAASCDNRRITSSVSEQAVQTYNELVSQYRQTINACINYFKKLWSSTSESIRYTSGHYNILRAESATNARIFDKRKTPDEKEGAAVMLLIDESGSMNGRKRDRALVVAVILTEVFSKLNIPLYIMGFHENDDIIHDHLLTWKNNQTTRLNLLGLSAFGCNADGYSIRYAAKILQQRKEPNKLMLILSDGAPSASIYHSVNTPDAAIEDTKNAIREARRTAVVCGFGIGSNLESMQRMYGNNFVTVDDIDELASVVIKKLKQLL